MKSSRYAYFIKQNSKCYLAVIVFKSDLDFKQNQTRNGSLSNAKRLRH